MALSCLEICDAACCRDIRIQLTRAEYERLKKGGTELWETWEEGVYRMDGPCSNLRGRKCLARGNIEEQPIICGRFRFLGFGCRDRRQAVPEYVRFYLQGVGGLGFEPGCELRFALTSTAGAWFFTGAEK